MTSLVATFALTVMLFGFHLMFILAARANPTEPCLQNTLSEIADELSPISRANLNSNYLHDKNAPADPLPLSKGVSVIVPVYCELHSGTLSRMIDSFVRQKASVDQYELVIVVNNTPELAQNVHDPAFIENQNTLQVLRYVSGETKQAPPILQSLPRAQQGIFEAARAAQMQIAVVDHSTAGTPKVIGKIRDLGVEQATSRHVDESRRLIAMMDADTTVPENYVSDLLHHFNHYHLDAAFLPLGYRVEPGTSPIHYQTSLDDRFKHIYTRFRWSVERIRGNGLTAGGPQTVVTAEALKKVGGVPHKSTNEDMELSHALAKNTRYRILNSIRVIASDRARLESFDGNGRLGQLKQGRNPKGPLQNGDLRRSFIVDLLRHHFERNPGPPVHEKIAKIFSFFDMQYTESGWKHEEQEYRNLQRDPSRIPVLVAIDAVYNHLGSNTALAPDDFLIPFLKQRLPPHEFQIIQQRLTQRQIEHDRRADELNENVRRMILNQPFDDSHEFLKGNVWLRDFIYELQDERQTTDNILSALRNGYPDWFRHLDRTPIMHSIINLETLTEVFHEAIDDPEAFPALYEVLEILSGKRPP